MTDQHASEHVVHPGPATIADVLDGVEPMGDLRRFAIDDLTPEEEDEFFRILEEA